MIIKFALANLCGYGPDILGIQPLFGGAASLGGVKQRETACTAATHLRGLGTVQTCHAF
jgi:hypothetical protein